MKKIFITYVSRTGYTKILAENLAEGVRLTGNEVVIKKISEVGSAEELNGYDGYLFGSPTYHRDMMNPMKTFLFLVEKAELKGKLAGAFGSYTHSGDAPKIILDTMEYVFGMKRTDLGSMNLLERVVDTDDGRKAGHDYAKAFVEELK
jgi:flavorubredoxin